ncbi:unnamed protein product [Periconia digitata]|uniref:Uncharacterized protein n=1 Tax=Periconia digitata TaxID=1303443 RepID=A0A9W4XU06_9PLEO|nr:unnamed protein product [Periconia digitata]
MIRDCYDFDVYPCETKLIQVCSTVAGRVSLPLFLPTNQSMDHDGRSSDGLLPSPASLCRPLYLPYPPHRDTRTPLLDNQQAFGRDLQPVVLLVLLLLLLLLLLFLFLPLTSTSRPTIHRRRSHLRRCSRSFLITSPLPLPLFLFLLVL